MEPSFRDDFEVMTTIRSDGLLANDARITMSPNTGPFYMFHLHRDRMLAALEAFNWPQRTRETLSNLQEHLRDHLKHEYDNPCYERPLKLRATLSASGKIKVTSTPMPAATFDSLFPKSLSDHLTPFPTFRIFVSPVMTKPSLFTSHKTTNREQYDEVRFFLPHIPSYSNQQTLSLPSEILLVNHKAEIMEGSFTTPYFLRAGQWITPAAESGGNQGTTRRYALASGLCVEGLVKRGSVQLGERVILSNGVRGFGWGCVEELQDMGGNGSTHQT